MPGIFGTSSFDLLLSSCHGSTPRSLSHSMFRMAVPVFTRLEGRVPISRHDHVAVLYRGRDAAFRLASFLAEGLERGESCSTSVGPSWSCRLRAARNL